MKFTHASPAAAAHTTSVLPTTAERAAVELGSLAAISVYLLLAAVISRVLEIALAPRAIRATAIAPWRLRTPTPAAGMRRRAVCAAGGTWVARLRCEVAVRASGVPKAGVPVGGPAVLSAAPLR